MALNSGIPCLLCNGDLRAREMSELFHIPRDYPLDHTVDLEKAYDGLDFSAMNRDFPILYKIFTDFAKKNEIAIINPIK